MISAETFQTTAPAQLCKALGDDLRLGVLQALARDSYGVLELAQAFGVTQSGMSHHLKILANTGLVTTRREGNSVFYRRTTRSPQDPLAPLKTCLLQTLDALPLAEPYQQGLGKVWHERAQASQKFFAEQAGKFRSQQDLIARFDVYGEQLADLLALSVPSARGLALEVGPGAGEFLRVLRRHFASVTALDNSAEMLSQARNRATAEQLTDIDFVLADTRWLHHRPAHFDCAVVNMVLHHTPSPAQMLADVALGLKPGGMLLLSELCLHDQTWARDACGDLWLGFDPQDLTDWADAAGFDEGQGVYFALRNGFQIQLRQFVRRNAAEPANQTTPYLTLVSNTTSLT